MSLLSIINLLDCGLSLGIICNSWIHFRFFYHSVASSGGGGAIHLCSTHTCTVPNYVSLGHRRRIKTAEKAKVVASVRGEEFIQYLTALAVLHKTILNNSDELHQDDLKQKDELTLLFNIVLGKIASAARN